MTPKKGRLLSSPMSCAEEVKLCLEYRQLLALPFTSFRFGLEVVKRVVAAVPGVNRKTEKTNNCCK